METEISNQHGAVVAAPAGPVDHASAAAFEAAVMPALKKAGDEGTPFVLDLSAVNYMSSVGLRVLMLVAKAAKPAGTPVAVAGLQPSLAEIFQISRFDKIFSIYADAETAAKEVNA